MRPIDEPAWRKAEVILEWILARAEDGADPVELMRRVLAMIKEGRWRALDELFGV